MFDNTVTAIYDFKNNDPPRMIPNIIGLINTNINN